MRRVAKLLLVALAVVGAFAATRAAFGGFAIPGGGSGRTRAQVMPAGNTPTVSNASGTSSVTVSWAQSSFSPGGGVAGYIVTRYNASNVAQTTGPGCSGTIAGLTCTETGVPDGAWHYTTTPVHGPWQGVASPSSATVTVTSCTKTFIKAGLNQSWHIAANWFQNAVPTTGDLVCIPDLGGSVFYNAGTTSVARVLAYEPVNVSQSSASLTIAAGGLPSSFSDFTQIGGTTTFNNAVTIGALTQTGGVITGTGAVGVTGTWHWGFGDQTGTGSTTALPGSTLTFDSPNFTRSLVNRTVVNQGTANWVTIPGVAMSGTAVFQNEGTLNLAASGQLSYSSGTPTVRNVAGATINVTSSTATFTIGTSSSNGLTFDNAGTVNGNAGTLLIPAPGSVTDTGTYTAVNAATVSFGGSRTLSGPVVSSGTIAVNGSAATSVVFNGSYTSVATTVNAGTFTLNGTIGPLGFITATGGTLVVNSPATTAYLGQTGGTISGTAALSVTTDWHWGFGNQTGTGSTTALAGSTFVVDSPNFTTSLTARTVVNRSTTATWSTAAGIQINSGGTFRNEGTLSLVGAAIVAGDSTGTFKNIAGGTINSAVAGQFTLTPSITFDNDGTVNVNGGTLAINVSGPTSDSDAGNYNVAGGTTLAFGQGSTGTSRTIAGTVTSAGTLAFGGSSVTLTGPYSSSVTKVTNGVVTFNNGATALTTLTHTGGTVTGSAALTVTTDWHWGLGDETGSGSTTALPGSIFVLDTAASNRNIVGRTIVNQTTASWTTFNGIQMNGGVFRNEGTLNVVASTGFGLNTGSPIVTNIAGATINGATGGTFTFGTGVAFDNDGVVNANTGTLAFNGNGVDADAGSYNVTSGATLSFGGGTRTIAGPIASAGTVAFAGATITDNGFYSSAATTVTGGNAILTGAVATLPALSQSAGTLTINSPLTVASLTETGGTLTGSNALTISSSWQWSSGAQTGTGSTTVLAAATLTIDTSASHSIDTRTVTNQSTNATMASTATNGVTLTNTTFRNEGTLNLAAAGTAFAVGSGTQVLKNTGTINRTGAGTSTINVVFDNDGVVNVNVATLAFNGSGVDTDIGQYNVSSGAILSFTNGTRTISGPTASLGTVVLSTQNPTITFTGSYASTATTASTGTANLNGPIGTLGSISTSGAPGGTVVVNTNASVGTLTQTGGAISGTATLTVTTSWQWSGGTQTGSGTTTAAAGSNFTIDSNGTRSMNARTVLNQSAAGSITMSTAISMTNASFQNSGTLNIATSSGSFDFSSGAPNVKNLGTGIINRTTSGTFNLNVGFDNDGTVNVVVGGIGINATSVDNDAGTYNVANGASLNFAAGTHTISGTVASLGTVAYSNGTTNFNGPYSSTATNGSGGAASLNGAIGTLGSITMSLLTSASLAVNNTASVGALTQTGNGIITGTGALTVSTSWTWSGGSQTGTGSTTILPGATVTVDTTNSHIINARTVITQSTNASLASTLTNGVAITNGSLQNSGTLNVGVVATISGSGAATANFKNLAGGIINRTTSGAFSVDNTVTFDNNGTINVNSGTFTVGTAFTNVTSGTLSRGVYKIGSGAAFRFANANVATLDASVTLNTSGVITDTAGSPLDGFRNLATITANATFSLINHTQTTSLPLTSNGTIVFDQGAQITTSGVLTLAGGSLGGWGSLQATTVNNTGALLSVRDPGVADTLSISGGYSQSGAGVLKIDVVGPPGAADLLIVSGAVNLGGTLSVATVGFTPAPGTGFTIILASSVAGSFSSITTTGGTNYTVSNLSTSVRIVAL